MHLHLLPPNLHSFIPHPPDTLQYSCYYHRSLQNYGNVETRQGRLLAFPNFLQHRFTPFRLRDPTKPGHCRFIALRLVDPHTRIVSTAKVPPQQLDWWAEAAFGPGTGPGKKDTASRRGDVPPEVFRLLMEEWGLARHFSSLSCSGGDDDDAKGEKAEEGAADNAERDDTSAASGNKTGEDVELTLPAELMELVRKEGILPPGLMSAEEARRLRLELMDKDDGV